MSPLRSWPALLLLLGLAACSEQASSPGPAPEPEPGPPETSYSRQGQDRLERLARRTARALRDPAFRADVRSALDASPYREQKVHFQRYLRADGGRRLRLVAERNGESNADLEEETARAGVLEMYFPVPEHRAAWQGDERLLVATASRDGDPPVAYDLTGRRQVLDPNRPPTTPVLAVQPAELDFETAGISKATCNENCNGGGGGAAPPPTPGLYLSRAEFVEDFEGWFKGDPEYEIHILGPAAKGDKQNVSTFQCIGQAASSPYRWDQNKTTWTGSQLLFSSAQMSAFEATHGSQPFSIMAIEDDDAGCQIRTDADRASKLFKALGTAYKDYKSATGQKLTPDGLTRILKAAQSGYLLLTSLYSVITTADDIIGIAIADSVAGRYRSGTNWTFMNDKVQANGYVQLQIRN